ncbi:MAG: hypothetical protein DME55_06535 [Verrucomicrobia bacterium]|nr:MAG: hypothetical protein DME55_06535 [Verrucomicrobiota bacterium]
MKDNSKRVVTLVLLGWLCFAVGLGGWFYNAIAPAVAATVWTLTALVLLACWKISPIRVWALNVDVRWLVLFHVTRLFAGAYFLVLCQRGELPCGFARPAGWGDIIVAVLALAVVNATRTRFAKMLLLVWNMLGLIDIIFVVFSALRFGLKDWQSMHALRELPLSLLPTFLVPLIIASHVLIFVRLTRARIGSQ